MSELGRMADATHSRMSRNAARLSTSSHSGCARWPLVRVPVSRPVRCTTNAHIINSSGTTTVDCHACCSHDGQANEYQLDSPMNSSWKVKGTAMLQQIQARVVIFGANAGLLYGADASLSLNIGWAMASACEGVLAIMRFRDQMQKEADADAGRIEAHRQKSSKINNLQNA